jgi:hypothetical protein
VLIAFDMDGTITAAPREFARLAQCYVNSGHKVIVLTYRDEDWRPLTVQQLKDIGFPYSRLVMLPHWSNQSAEEFKAEAVLRLRVKALFDNDRGVLEALPAEVERILVWTGTDGRVGLTAL